MPSTDRLYEIRQSLFQGVGLFATANIPRGTRNLAEAPLLTCNNEVIDTQHLVDDFFDLSPTRQASYLALHYHESDSIKLRWFQATGGRFEDEPPLLREILAICQGNSMSIDPGSQMGVFLIGSRFNHSCVPNVHWVYNLPLEKQTFHTLCDVAKGEELTVYYIANALSQEESQKQLRYKWGFECTCSWRNAESGQRARLMEL